MRQNLRNVSFWFTSLHPPWFVLKLSEDLMTISGFFLQVYFSTFLIRIHYTIIENSKTVSTSLTFGRFQSSAKGLLLIFLKFGNRKFSFYRICRGLVAAYLVDSKKLLSYGVTKVQGSAGAKCSAGVILHMQETNQESYIYIINRLKNKY